METRDMERGIKSDNKNCFEKCWFIKNGNLMEVEKENIVFERFEGTLISDIPVAEFVNFNADILASMPLTNEHEINWR